MSDETSAPGTDTSAVAALNVEGWSPGEDVIVVQRSPAPGAARSTWRSFRETARGLKTTLSRVVEGTSTIQYLSLIHI